MTVENLGEYSGGGNPAGRKADEFADFPRGRGGRPKIIRAVETAPGVWEVPTDADGRPIKELVPYTRASTLGGALEYGGGLAKWKAAVSVYGVVRSRTLAKRARAIDGYSRADQKGELYEIVEKAQAFAESDSAANHGTALHTIGQRIAEGETVDQLVERGAIDEDDVPAAVAFEDAISRWQVLYCERRVVCDEAQAAGKYDLIVTARRPMPVTDAEGTVVDVIMPGEKIVVDLKTSSSADYFGEKFAVQLWVYANGRDYDKETGQRTEVGVNKRWALILHIPSGSGLDDNGRPTGEPVVANWHWVDLRKGAELVRVAQDVLEGRRLGKAAIVPADLDAEIPAEMMGTELADDPSIGVATDRAMESAEEQAVASLGPALQAAAALRKREDALIRRVQSATSVDQLVTLHQNAVLHDLFTDRVKPHFSRRKQELRPVGAH
jgi:hypothetical protein